jgi:hypothetical protein
MVRFYFAAYQYVIYFYSLFYFKSKSDSTSMQLQLQGMRVIDSAAPLAPLVSIAGERGRVREKKRDEKYTIIFFYLIFVVLV